MRPAISGLVWTTAAVSDSTKKPSSLAMLSMRAIAVTMAQLAIGAFSATRRASSCAFASASPASTT